jgi:endonuclease III related protein
MPATRILPSPAPFRKRPRTAQASLPVAHRLLSVPPNSQQSLSDASFATRHSPLATYYDALFRAYGPQHWWPGRTRFEIIVGAILTQNTSWTNVERAIANLRREKLLSPSPIEKIPFARLAKLIRSSGYFRQKARKLKAFVRFLRERYQGSLKKLFATPTAELREQLLGVHGIGPETADSILLYAGQRKVFVVDAYTRRILERHGPIHAKATYEEIRTLFEQNLPGDTQLYNEYHALIVHTGKHYCHTRQPNCAHCPLQHFLPSESRTPHMPSLHVGSSTVAQTLLSVRPNSNAGPSSSSSLATQHSPLATSIPPVTSRS